MSGWGEVHPDRAKTHVDELSGINDAGRGAAPLNTAAIAGIATFAALSADPDAVRRAATRWVAWHSSPPPLAPASPSRTRARRGSMHVCVLACMHALVLLGAPGRW